MEKSPNWLEMPDELMANILQRLFAAEILNSARKVCTTWRKICSKPEMWKVIFMHKSVDDWEGDYHFERLTKQAVDLSCGELIGISIKGFGTDELLNYVVLRKLDCLFLSSCYDITGSGLSQAVKRAPQLEKLYISSISINTQNIEVIGQNCPQLKSFMVSTEFIRTFINCDDNALAIANNLPELRRLKLFDMDMTNIGLQAILNGCPHLEVLSVRMCYDLNLDENLRSLCMERIKDFKFFLEIQDFDYDDYGLSSRDVDLFPDYSD
ncbi:unnamed protein product [Lactuca virosa]|uniref:F-box domain-containing protein n=1 Tax=Lactuca virosa TaxID=75947 RepID=A0AAU9PEX0_9ASTR|nr:unnamed protein product [Lactuca virosa]